jgi:hypothetical protein
MVRLFFQRHKQQRPYRSDRQSDGNKKRLSPSVDWNTNAIEGGAATAAVSNEAIPIPSSARRTRIGIDSPMYRYAMDEYAQAVAPGTSNDDGRMDPQVQADYSTTGNTTSNIATPRITTSRFASMTPGLLHTMDHIDPAAPSSLFGVRVSSGEERDNDERDIHEESADHQRQVAAANGVSVSDNGNQQAPNAPFAANEPNQSTYWRQNSGTYAAKLPTTSDTKNDGQVRWSSFDMPDATYEEVYGEAYVGGTIKYVYPSGYQSMRPRSCPWKLSIVICLLFTWLSVFIVGHCSDQTIDVNENAAAATAAASDAATMDDDDVRWCGSRPLYLLWVASMLVTGISAAYCSVIGYIKVRDFAVANARSQPPGVAQGSSDYYVHIHDDAVSSTATQLGPAVMMVRGGSGSEGGASSSFSYRPTIYQSDGTPQFWGAHIYRPTQAAVAVTSR